MGIGVLVIGKSGSGKSTSLRNFGHDELTLINVLGKPLPFRGRFDSTLATDDYRALALAIRDSSTKSIAIDDAGYLITNHFMRGHGQGGKGGSVFDLYNSMAHQFWTLIDYIKSLAPEKIVYFLMHEDQSDDGRVKPKTIGRMLDEKVCIEGEFAIVLRALTQDGKHVFRTQTDGLDVAKTPMDMFEGELIDNDLRFVDATIRDYYGLESNKEAK
jgi:hypothetical protein